MALLHNDESCLLVTILHASTCSSIQLDEKVNMQEKLERQVAELQADADKAASNLAEQRRLITCSLTESDQQHEAAVAAVLAARDDATASLQRQHAVVISSMQVIPLQFVGPIVQ